jgi:D-glycero-D-manno-heptose 1,7-bisphosphate phosphatase
MSTPEIRLRRAAFIDRDGVINEEREYVHKVEDFVILPGAVAGLKALQDAGFTIVVVTNQAGIGRGLYTEAAFHELTLHMQTLLSESGVHVSGVYFCPHHPTAGLGPYRQDCECRKPRPGMLRRAAREMGLDLSRSVLVGDKMSDVEAGRSAGLAEAVLVETGHALSPADRHEAPVFADLPSAARHLIAATADPERA